MRPSEQAKTAVASNGELEHDEVRDRESDVGLELEGQNQAYETERCRPRSPLTSGLPLEWACVVRAGGAPRRDTPTGAWVHPCESLAINSGRCSSSKGLLSAHGDLVGKQPHKNDCDLVRRRCIALTAAHQPGEPSLTDHLDRVRLWQPSTPAHAGSDARRRLRADSSTAGRLAAEPGGR